MKDPHVYPTTTTDAGNAFAAGLARHRAGDLHAAQAAYRQCLVAHPTHRDALHMLGVACLQQGQPEDAVEWLRKSLAAAPAQPLVLANLGAALIALKRFDQALSVCDEAVRLGPQLAQAHCNRGAALRALSRPEDALIALRQAAALDRDNVEIPLLMAHTQRDLGDPTAAIDLYREAIRLRPRGIDARVALASVLIDVGQPGDSLQVLDEALRLAPGSAAALNNRANSLRLLGRFDEALADCQRALSLQPNYPRARLTLGNVLRSIHRLEDALLSFDTCLRLDPRNVEALTMSGDVLLSLGRVHDARARFDAALQIDAGHVQALCGRATTMDEASAPDEARDWHRRALAACDHALSRPPRHAPILTRKGAALLGLNFFEEAIACFDQALSIAPLSVRPRVLRALALARQHRLDRALDDAEALVTRDPMDAEAWHAKGSILLGQDAEQALACFERAAQLRPGVPTIISNRCTALLQLQRHQEAADALSELLRLAPDHPYATGLRLYARAGVCDWTAHDAETEKVRQQVRAARAADLPWSFLNVPASAEEQLQCARAYAVAEFPPRQLLWRGEQFRNARIRVAYLSSDFQAHATSYLIAGLFERHDRERFEVHALSYGPDIEDEVRARLRRGVERFHEVRGLSDEEIARWLHEQQFDIVVDLKGHTLGSRLGILSHRPCPLQLTYLGHPGTLGVDFIDYLIADEVVVPPGERHNYTERVLHLPGCYQVNDSAREIASWPATRAEAGLPDHGFVFCCLNNCFKIAPPVFDVWMRLLASVPDSHLWLYARNEQARANLRKEAVRRGVADARLVFAEKLPQAQHLARYRLADLFLDTLPVNAHTTASDALWAGLPVLSCTGSTFAGRVATSLLCAVGLPELATASLAEYEALALELATTPSRLASLRARLDMNRGQSALFDTRRFVTSLECAYLEIWSKWQRGEPPANLAVR